LTTPLLSTKFSVPPISQNLVPRSRLLQKLNAGLRQVNRLSLISAPAGYGKTTLISEWLHTINEIAPIETVDAEEPAAPICTAWLTLDPGDDDLARFVAYLVASLQQIQPGVGEGALAALRTPKPGSPVMLATLLVNDLLEIPGPFVLVLDDYHTITALPIHDFLSCLIDHQPSQMCLVLGSRADPPLPLPRLRARGQLVEIRQDDLTFNRNEAAEFLNSVMGLSLTRDVSDALEKQTEGWIVGLQLAALSMRDVQDVPAFIESFSGRHEFIADYLTDEVLSHQPKNQKAFLLQTSILDRLSAPLCEAVTRQEQAQDTLEQMSEANLFLIQLDHQQEWYRYHALFADLLRKRLQQTQGTVVNELHQRASQWYRDNGILALAVEHALTGKDYQSAVELIEQAAEPLLKRSETISLVRWLEALPDEQIRLHPALITYYGLALLFSGKPTDKLKSLSEKVDVSESADNLQGEFATFKALLAIMEGDAAESIRLSERALERLPPGRPFFRCLAADSLGMAYTLQGDTDAAVRAFEQVVQLSEQTGNVVMTIMALSNLAGLRFQQGQLRLSETSYRQVLDLAAAQLGKHSPATGKAFLGLGALTREWNDLESALQYYFEAAEMLEKFAEIGLPIAYLSIAMVKAEQNEWESVQSYIERAKLCARASTGTPLDDLLVEGLQARFWVMQGELHLAEHWAQSRGLIDKPLGKLQSLAGRSAAAGEFQQGEYLTLARLLLAKKRPRLAVEVLDPLLDTSDRKGHNRRVIEILILKSLALAQSEAIDDALQVLSRTLSLAEPEGYIRTFLDEGEEMARLLYKAAERGYSPEYAGRLLAEFSDLPSITPGTSETAAEERLVEPLSERELQVLTLIAEGLSNREIAGRLYISLSTVKGHTTNIYGKLGVNNRTQAVTRGRSLCILPAN